MTEFFKSKATLSLRLADGIPIYPMKFPLARIMSHQKYLVMESSLLQIVLGTLK